MEQNSAESRPLDMLDVEVWNLYWAEVERRIGPVFARSEARERALAFLAGLLSPAERKNSWQLAEMSGDVNPYGFQHLLGRADWNADVLRDLLYDYVTDYLADSHAVGVIDETGFVKKGTHSAGVARQYSGTAGRVENCQVGVVLAYASRYGHTLLDRELYLPAEWTDDPERCGRAGIAAERAFATKPELARQMVERTLKAGVKLAWVTGDSVYGDDRRLRHWLARRQQAYVLALSGKESLWLGEQQRQVKVFLAELPGDGWERLSAGLGSKGPRWYDWLQIELSQPSQLGWKRWLLVRRNIAEPTKQTAYLVFALEEATLSEMIRVAGMRWTVEESIQTAKGEVGLDQYEVRSWTGWYRHITLAMWAQAFLSVIRVERGTGAVLKKGRSNQTLSSLERFKAQRGLSSG